MITQHIVFVNSVHSIDSAKSFSTFPFSYKYIVLKFAYIPRPKDRSIHIFLQVYYICQGHTAFDSFYLFSGKDVIFTSNKMLAHSKRATFSAYVFILSPQSCF